MRSGVVTLSLDFTSCCKKKKRIFLETPQKTNRLFVQALSGMASKVPFTEDRVALAGDGGDDLGGGDDDVVSDESCDL